jgi:hypothetical protein
MTETRNQKAPKAEYPATVDRPLAAEPDVKAMVAPPAAPSPARPPPYVGSNPTPATLFPQVRAGLIGWWHRLLRADGSGSRTVCGLGRMAGRSR